MTTDKEILHQYEAFYRNLYRSKIGTCGDEYDHLFFENPIHKKLNQHEQGICEDPLTNEECLKALKEMECTKMPGSDVLPAEFYGTISLYTFGTMSTMLIFVGSCPCLKK